MFLSYGINILLRSPWFWYAIPWKTLNACFKRSEDRQEITSLKGRLLALFSVYSGTKQSNVLEQNMTWHYIKRNSNRCLRVPYLGPGFTPCTLSFIVPQSYWERLIFLISKTEMRKLREVTEPLRRFLTGVWPPYVLASGKNVYVSRQTVYHAPPW